MNNILSSGNEKPKTFSKEQELAFSRALETCFRLFIKYYYVSLPLCFALYTLSRYAIVSGKLYQSFREASPELFEFQFVQSALNAVSFDAKVWIVFGFYFLLTAIPLCILGIMHESKYAKIFRVIALSNGAKEYPHVLEVKKLDRYRTRLTVFSQSIDLEAFRAKQGRIEAHFGQTVESINHGKDQRIVSITMTRKKLADRVSYSDLCHEKPLPPESFYVGETLEGPLVSRIADLPHMLIAGSTGSGKSVFFKQALMGLLESSPHVMMCMLDLKGGLEMQDFKDVPNVVVSSNIKDAVDKLKLVQEEMNSRFQFMKEKNLKLIDPKLHEKDRIIVAVDESSVLFSTLQRVDPHYAATLEARTILDNLTKLGRAAAIHMILATQKLEKAVIPTTVSENIAARMAFKANSVPGSVLVTGTRDAMDLPDTKGRALWVLGAKQTLVQAPIMTDTEIVRRCEVLKEEFGKEQRKIFQGDVFKRIVNTVKTQMLHEKTEKKEVENVNASLHVS